MVGEAGGVDSLVLLACWGAGGSVNGSEGNREGCRLLDSIDFLEGNHRVYIHYRDPINEKSNEAES